MSRYLILFLLNMPFAIIGIVNATVSYKLDRLNKRRFISRIMLWGSVILGLIFAAPLYNYLFSNKLTQSEPLSLFDVIQITGIIVALFAVSRNRAKVDALERRMRLLHQELSIKLSGHDSRKLDGAK